MIHKFDKDIFDLAVTGEDCFVAGFSTGHVGAYQWSMETKSVVELWSTKRHKQSCRSVSANRSANTILTAGSDKVIKLAASETGRVSAKWSASTASEAGTSGEAYSVIQWLNNDIFVTGDDAGQVGVWDSRTKKGVIRLHDDHIDYISSITPFDDRYAVVTSGDGTLSVIDARNPKKTVVSEDQEDDLTCGSFVRTNHAHKKFVVGTAAGVVTLFTKGDWGDHTDRILSPLPRSQQWSVDQMVQADSDSVFVGGGDGAVRLLHILPNRYERVIGQLEKDAGVDTLTKSDDGQYVLASSGSDLGIWKFEEESESESAPSSDSDSGSDLETELSQEKQNPSSNNEGSEQEEDSSDSDFDEPTKKKPKKRKTSKPPARDLVKTDFFNDM
ncbi:WDR55 family WD repeat protein [Schizosaccharomyces japonicus yFS275]|uniref:WDR55 family WD repeat protein n=1 Tax=Schizosaccharomyces japonicus (strain yFS275 / FY16936) TaxID=402676 RepID=B6JZQ0_SCHJY|nr:WDR55 family WD repeat protein [Schizosaccharomyces japonicus yFS275]EEB07018.1 WDR55 family WD repeat protein [Schizosaccharomyces japonicus yFS275]